MRKSNEGRETQLITRKSSILTPEREPTCSKEGHRGREMGSVEGRAMYHGESLQ